LRFSKDFTTKITPKHIHKTLSLPMLDPWSEQLREISERQRGSIGDLVEFAGEVPEYGAFMVKLGASGWFGAERAVEGIEDALACVGLDMAATLALIMLYVRDSRAGSRHFDWRPLWQHSVTVGLLADRLTEFFGLRQTGYELQAGFLHDIGKVVLGDVVPMSAIAAMRRSFDERRDLAQCERDGMNMDHSAAGVVWSVKERLSSAVIEVIATHHAPEQANRYRSLVAAVNLANHLAKRFGMGYSGNGVLDTPRLEDQPGLQILVSRSKNDLDLATFRDHLASQVPRLPLMTTG